MKTKILVAMSGGVDSAVAPLLLRDAGYTVGGAIMELRPGMDAEIRRAETIAGLLGIPFYVFPMQKEFGELVIQPFVRTYLQGGTPNPCIFCNQKLKFGRFLEEAEKLGYDGISTGHYASVSLENGRYVLKKSATPEKDQSYVLYGLTQNQLSKAVFPLGTMRKETVKAIAKEHMFASDELKESQDICFIPEGDHTAFIRRMTGAEDVPGPFLDVNGNLLGTHRGITHYTVGQRKGLGLALPEPYFVLEKDASRNAVILCPKRDLRVPSFLVNDFNWVSVDRPDQPIRCTVRTRYHQKEMEALLIPEEGENVRFEFGEPQEKPARGQSAVAYSGDYVIGGGIIA